jgi:hypothetical protein
MIFESFAVFVYCGEKSRVVVLGGFLTSKKSGAG